MSLTSSTATLAALPPGPGPAPPAASKPNPRRRASHSHSVHRRASEHHAHGNRRPSHGHGHTALGGFGLTALTTTVSNGSDGSDSKGKKRSGKRDDRPPARTSRSDTHLPRLSRVNSTTSTTSHKSNISGRTPPTTTVIHGGETPDPTPRKGTNKANADEDEGDWESGEDDDEEDAQPLTVVATSAAMRRTKSDTTAMAKTTAGTENATSRAPRAGSPSKMEKPNINPLQTKKRASSIAKHSVLGFGGLTRTPMAEDSNALEREPSNPGYSRGDEPGHVGIVAPAKRQMSSVNLHNLPSRKASAELTEDTRSAPAVSAPDDSDTETDRSDDDRASASAVSDKTPKIPTPLRKRASRREVTPEITQSPTKYTDSQPLGSALPRTSKTAQPLQGTQTQPESQSQSRVTSQNHALRHRPSYSSLRSTQSFRAPPHPLNSPSTAGFAVTAATVGLSSRQRVASMHFPPLAPPEVSTAVAEGHGWDGLPNGSDAPNTPTGKSQLAPLRPPNHARKSSVSSNRSIRSLFAPQQGRHPGHHVTDALSANGRLTALAATTAASKLLTTTDPQLYHHSLGYPSTEAETAHLISRFLPVKESEVRRQSILGDSPFASAHRSLVSTMKNLGIGVAQNVPNDHHTVTGGLVGPEHAQYQRIDTRRKGKSPLELSLDRCWSLRAERGIDPATPGAISRMTPRTKSTLGPSRGGE